MRPLISIITPTHNREDMIGRAIESVLAQTMPNFEMVIVDDGSTDGGGKVADEYAAKDDRIRVIHLPTNKGISFATNTGIVNSKGEYIAFLDDDDWLYPDYMEFLYGLIQEFGADIAICGLDGRSARNFDERLVMTGEEAVLQLLHRRRYNSMPAAKLFRRSLFEEYLFPGEYKVSHDAAVMYKLLAAAKKIAYHGLPKTMIFQHPNNLSAWMDNNRALNDTVLGEKLKIYRERRDWLIEKYPQHMDYFCYIEWSFMISMTRRINVSGATGCDVVSAYMREELTANAEKFLSCQWIKDAEKEGMAEYIMSER